MWKKLKIDDLPKGEVVAANFTKGDRSYGSKVITNLIKAEKVKNQIYVKTGFDWSEWMYVTHYLPLPKDEEREG